MAKRDDDDDDDDEDEVWTTCSVGFAFACTVRKPMGSVFATVRFL